MIRSAATIAYFPLAATVLPAPVHAATVDISGTFSGDATLTPKGTPGLYLQNFTGGRR
jgi:hypothetical protein